MRLIGLIFMCGGFCMLGVCAARYTKKREKNLRELISGLETACREMKYSLAPLPDLFRQSASQTTGDVSAFFSECAYCADCIHEFDFKTNWMQMLDRYRLCLEEADLMVLKQLGGVLGRYDGDEQIRAFNSAIDRLRELCRLAEMRSDQLGKVYTALGMISGAFAFLLFI